MLTNSDYLKGLRVTSGFAAELQFYLQQVRDSVTAYPDPRSRRQEGRGVTPNTLPSENINWSWRRLSAPAERAKKESTHEFELEVSQFS
jgi:hypothetical protein